MCNVIEIWQNSCTRSHIKVCACAHMLAHMHACMHAYTHKSKKEKKTKLTAAMLNIIIANQWTGTLGCLCTTQVLEPCAGKSSWGGRASNPYPGGLSRSQGEPTTIKWVKESGPFASPVYIRYPLMLHVTAGQAASPDDTRPLGPPFKQLGDWSNVRKVTCSSKQQQHQSGHTRNQTWNLMITRAV